MVSPQEQFGILEREVRFANDYQDPYAWGLGTALLYADGRLGEVALVAINVEDNFKSAAVLFGASEQEAPGEPRFISWEKLIKLLPLFASFEHDGGQHPTLAAIRRVLADMRRLRILADPRPVVILAWLTNPEDDADTPVEALLQLMISDQEDLEATQPYTPSLTT